MASLWKNDATELVGEGATGTNWWMDDNANMFTRSNPLAVATNLQVTLNNGDWLRLNLDGPSNPDYVGVAFTLTPVPEPSGVVLSGFSLVGLLLRMAQATLTRPRQAKTWHPKAQFRLFQRAGRL